MAADKKTPTRGQGGRSKSGQGPDTVNLTHDKVECTAGTCTKTTSPGHCGVKTEWRTLLSKHVYSLCDRL